jgi:hypothetical protein
MKIKYIIICSLCILLSSCDDLHGFLFQEIGKNDKKEEKVPNKELRPLDKLFLNGFQMELEQVYIMSANVPYDSCFNGNQNVVVNLPNFQTTDYNGNLIMTGLTKGMKWQISKMLIIPHSYEIEHGYGSNYFVSVVNDTIYQNYIDLGYKDILFLTNYVVGDIYTYRHPDNHILPVWTEDKNGTQYGNAQSTNLKLEITNEYKEGDKYIWLQTNNQYSITYLFTAPLTGNQVAQILNNGKEGIDYEIYLWNGLTTYKIGENLYIPRYNSYVYIASTNQNGLIREYTRLYYRLKFRIV